MKLIDANRNRAQLSRLVQRGALDLKRVEKDVCQIVRDVRRKGDTALFRYARKLDDFQGKTLRIGESEINAAWQRVAPEFRRALETAAHNIRRFCEWQRPQEWIREVQPGIRLGQLVRPIESVGCYVPGGRHPLPSTLLMTVIPAQVAGVKRIVVTSPRPAAETLAAAAFLGIEEFYAVGGAQAISALAYGTKSLPRVAKIVGPGNAYVTAAKKQVAFDCAIDMLAGPTEAVIVSEKGRPQFLAADLVAQAEHDPDALSIFITSNPTLARNVIAECNQQAASNAVARKSLARNGYAILTSSPAEALTVGNALAPEHLTVASERELAQVEAAGSVFVGDFSAQATGDYVSGPNHVLPTGGSARYRGGLSVSDFVKLITVQEYSAKGLTTVAKDATALAQAEGLLAHAQSIAIRMAAS
ncbi:MAG: histidinol dehydrogenase [Acidobacteria bacterium]|nr:histidinol dehydrogenase [Acidobacteriota bacterium]MBV9436073.1 histidinol dehydrogenase [Acidobacteriota bacterium]